MTEPENNQLTDTRTVVQWLPDRELYEAVAEVRFLSPGGEFVFRATAWGPELYAATMDAQAQVQEMGVEWERSAP